MTTIYVAGPMTGYLGFNYPAFHAAATELRVLGYTVENPAENPRPTSDPWVDFMRDALAQVIRSDAVALLPGWEQSRGAQLEERVARSLGLDIRPLNDWIEATP